MKRILAMTREVSPAFADCQLTHLARMPIDVDRARTQHAAYEQALGQLGCAIQRLSSAADMPDAVFIEDTAIVLDEIAVITRPGAASRRGEVDGVATALARYRGLVPIEAPGTMDGGDVLLAGRSIFVGRSSRTNDDGFEQFRRAVTPFGYTVSQASVHGCLHLKSAVTTLDDRTLLVNRRWIESREFSAFTLVDVDTSEPTAANIVRVGGRLLYASAFPKTLAGLRARGYDVTCIDVSEIAKAEGAVTCCSLIFELVS